jgi:hypothetical protein
MLVCNIFAVCVLSQLCWQVFHIFSYQSFFFPRNWFVAGGCWVGNNTDEKMLTGHVYWNFGQPHLKIKIVGGRNSICVPYKGTLRTFVSTLDFAMLIVLHLG